MSTVPFLFQNDKTRYKTCFAKFLMEDFQVLFTSGGSVYNKNMCCLKEDDAEKIQQLIDKSVFCILVNQIVIFPRRNLKHSL